MRYVSKKNSRSKRQWYALVLRPPISSELHQNEAIEKCVECAPKQKRSEPVRLLWPKQQYQNTAHETRALRPELNFPYVVYAHRGGDSRGGERGGKQEHTFSRSMRNKARVRSRNPELLYFTLSSLSQRPRPRCMPPRFMAL